MSKDFPEQCFFNSTIMNPVKEEPGTMSKDFHEKCFFNSTIMNPVKEEPRTMSKEFHEKCFFNSTIMNPIKEEPGSIDVKPSTDFLDDFKVVLSDTDDVIQEPEYELIDVKPSITDQKISTLNFDPNQLQDSGHFTSSSSKISKLSFDPSQLQVCRNSISSSFNVSSQSTEPSDSASPQSSHTGEKSHTLNSHDYERHMLMHGANATEIQITSYDCRFCGKIFKQFGNLKNHMRIHTEEKPYCCQECDRGFDQISAFKIHMRTHESSSSNSGRKISEQGFDLNQPQGCGHSSNISSNVSSESTEPLSSDNASSVSSNQSSHNGEKIQKCEKTLHQSNPEPPGIIIKDLMDYSGINRPRESLINKEPLLLMSSPTNDNPVLVAFGRTHYKCYECDEYFEVSEFISKHMSHVPKKDNASTPFKCQFCEQVFAKSEDLTIHARKHKGETNFKCQKCGITLNSHNYKRHMLTHASATDKQINSLKCQLCDKTFRRYGNLKHHMKKHRPFNLSQPQSCGHSTDISSNVSSQSTEPLSSGNASPVSSNQSSHIGEKAHPCEKTLHQSKPEPPGIIIKDFMDYSGINRPRESLIKKEPLLLMSSPTNDNPVLVAFGKAHYKCYECDEYFEVSEFISKHMSHVPKRDNASTPFKCQFCEQVFAKSEELTIHARKHKGENTFICQKCGITLNSHNYKRHMLTHASATDKQINSLKCQLCGKTFRRYGNLKHHMRKHRPFNLSQPQSCGHSTGISSNVSSQSTEPLTSDNASPVSSNQSSHNGEKTHPSDKTLNQDQSDPEPGIINDLIDHNRPGESLIKKKPLLLMSSPTNDNPVLVAFGKARYKCFECDEYFEVGEFISRHMSHVPKKKKKYLPPKKAFTPFKCELCAKAFAKFEDLTVHIRKHKGEKFLKCQKCGKALNGRNYKRHMLTHASATEKQIDSFECQFCVKTCTTFGNLKIHMRIHTGEKPYLCPECGRSFAQSSALKIHMRTHSGEKPFCCRECGKCFNQSSALTIHMRIHTGETPNQCPKCDKSFSTSAVLKTHMRTHTGEKPYQCQECGIRVSVLSNLKVHMRKHNREKQFTCEECDKAFSTKSNLKKHMQKHSGEN